MQCMRKSLPLYCFRGVKLTVGVKRGCEPLTPADIAEIVVFAAGRRENVILADTLVFPNHQVCLSIPCGVVVWW